MNKILLIDDDEKLCVAIQKYNDLVFEVDYLTEVDMDNINSLHDYILGNKYDLVIFDMQIGEVNGYELFEKLKPIGSIPIVFLSGAATVDMRINALSAGAEDFITKPIDLKELQIKLKKYIERNVQTDIQKINEYEFDDLQQKAYRDGRDLKLTSAAYKLLKYLVTNPNVELSRKKIMRELWNYEIEEGNRIVDTNINLIRNETKDPAIITVRGVGYKYEIK